MRVIDANSVDEAFCKGLELLRAEGIREGSRNGPVLVMPCPVTTVFHDPRRRVLLNPRRDANPFFHLFEALFYLAGRNDIKWLDRFVGDFSARFAEPDGTLHGSYGHRWRKHFDMEWRRVGWDGKSPFLPDQLETVVKLLKANPQDRQAVLTMWDPIVDLGVPGLKDRPCNTHIYLRVQTAEYGVVGEPIPRWLDITVCCRSNDVVWGAYGANAVHFSILHEYLAARIGVGVGTYYQISNNYHGYEATTDFECLKDQQPYIRTAEPTPLVTVPDEFDADLARFFEWTESDDAGKNGEDDNILPWEYKNVWFSNTAEPLFVAHVMWKHKKRDAALEIVNSSDFEMSPDWQTAAQEWFQRRMAKG